MIKVLTLEKYKDWNSIPDATNNDLQDKQLENFIDDATNSIDDLCGGKVFREYPIISVAPISQENELRIYKLQRAISSMTLLLDQTGKMFYSSQQVGGGSAPFSLNTTSENASVEGRRQDIVKSLIQGDWYKNTTIDNDIVVNSEDNSFEEKVVQLMNKYFLRTDGTNTFNGPELTLANGSNLNGSQNLLGRDVINPNTGLLQKPMLFNYDLGDSVVNNSTNSDKVLDPTDMIYKAMNKWNPNVFNAYTREQANELINRVFNASGIAFNLEFNYPKDFLVFEITTTKANISIYYYVSLINDNKGNAPTPKGDNEFWAYIPDKDVPIGEIIEMLKPYIDNEIANLPQVEVGEGLVLDDTLDIIKLSDTTITTLAQVEVNKNDIVVNKENINLKVDTITFNESQDLQDIEIAKKQDIEEWKIGSCIKNTYGDFTFNFNVADTKRVQITIIQDYQSANYFSPFLHIDMDLNDVLNVAKGFHITQYGYSTTYGVTFSADSNRPKNNFGARYTGTPTVAPRPQDIIIKYLLKDKIKEVDNE